MYNKIFEHYCKLLSDNISDVNGKRIQPHNYVSLSKIAVLLELKGELDKLYSLFYAELTGSEGELQEKFKKLCAAREQRIKGTILSDPNSYSNMLYWDLIKVLFAHHSLQELLGIIFPSINTVLSLDITYCKPAKQKPILGVVAKEIDISKVDFSKKDLSLSTVFGSFIIDNNIVFDVEQIVDYSFELQMKVCELLQNKYPQLQKKLYEHNKDLKKLFDNIIFFKNGGGRTPEEVITTLIKEFKFSGVRYTGNENDTPLAASYALNNFLTYLDELPLDYKEQVLAMKDKSGETSIGLVKNRLTIGSATDHCVELAADDLQEILVNPDNAVLLKSRPFVSADQVKEIEKIYSGGKGVSVLGQEVVTLIPSDLIQESLKGMVINNPYDFIELLNLLPAEQYSIFLENITITDSEKLFNVLAENMDELSNEKHNEFVDCLLKGPDCFGGLNQVFLLACKYNHVDLVKRLVFDPNFDLGIHGNYGFCLAAGAGHSKIVKIFLAEPRIEISDIDAYTLSVCMYFHPEIAKLLSCDPRMNFSEFDRYAIIVASAFGRYDVVKSLLSEPSVDPSNDDNAALLKACKHGHYQVVKLLLCDPRVDPSNDNNAALLKACENGHYEIVELLLCDPRINSIDNKSQALKVAEHGGFLNIVKLLRNNLAAKKRKFNDAFADDSESIKMRKIMNDDFLRSLCFFPVITPELSGPISLDENDDIHDKLKFINATFCNFKS